MSERKSLIAWAVVVILGCIVGDVLFPAKNISPNVRFAIAAPALTLIAVYLIVRHSKRKR